MNLGTVRSPSSPSWFQVQCTQGFKKHWICAIFLVFCFPDVYSYGSRVLHVVEAQQCIFWTLVMETSLFVDNAWLWLQLDHGAAHLGSRSFVQRDANNTETVLFTMFFVFLLYGLKGEERNMTSYSGNGETVHIPDKLHWYLMETSFLVRNA